MTVLPLADARARLSALIDSAVTTHERFEITRNGMPAAVLLSADDYESLRETIEILADPEAMRANAEALAELDAGLYITGEEMQLVMEARQERVELADDEMAVIEHMHARGIDDEVCLSALRSLIAHKRRAVA